VGGGGPCHLPEPQQLPSHAWADVLPSHCKLLQGIDLIAQLYKLILHAVFCQQVENMLGDHTVALRQQQIHETATIR
jgi:hypothetical protein